MLADDGGSSTGGKADLEHGVGALERFKSRVDVLLGDLESSAAGRTRMGGQEVSRTSFSGQNAGFAEADALYSQYNRVHQSLTSLSKTLSDQIEYLSLGVHAAAVGMDNTEDEVRRRFLVIKGRLDREQERTRYEGQHDKKSDAGWAAE
ncbi:hypothetical protein OG233_07670 [Streptomyces sp. NBC_01218]|uniref:hypothetical protein n=1 Tax=unclassified Streptomyces TaxID=2593676 RepID=UPI0023B9FEA1|nr:MULTISPECIES: hypothetical protein [unclassified Streptomyces]WEH39369.1 hypothetical protein PZB77_07460 [Streptomyces sp. AM 2-1-1]WSQ51066.1 hypothetical protein OG233_07670 [Streptomyces sp. NBC_01218]